MLCNRRQGGWKLLFLVINVMLLFNLIGCSEDLNEKIKTLDEEHNQQNNKEIMHRNDREE